LVNVVPPSVETCHCTNSGAVPDADALNDTFEPAATVWLEGELVILGREKPVLAWRVVGGVNPC
jgi:hypothetical protein